MHKQWIVQMHHSMVKNKKNITQSIYSEKKSVLLRIIKSWKWPVEMYSLIQK